MVWQTYLDGNWVEGNPRILPAQSHALWLSSIVFDGGRAFEGVTPDLDLHCERLISSCRNFGMKPVLSAGEVEELALEGVAKFPKDAELYIRPMMWAEHGQGASVDPDSTRFTMMVHDAPLPPATGFSCHLSRFRRPTPECAPTYTKSSGLYPIAAQALAEASAKGFDNAVMLDMNGNVAEFANSNIFIAKDGKVHTPAINGTFLNGITRQRIIQLLRDAGVEVFERAITWPEVMDADEVFNSGNYAKVVPVTRVEDRELQPGPIAGRARELYWEFSHK